MRVCRVVALISDPPRLSFSDPPLSLSSLSRLPWCARAINVVSAVFSQPALVPVLFARGGLVLMVALPSLLLGTGYQLLALGVCVVSLALLGSYYDE